MIETLGVRSYVSYIRYSSIIENKPSRGYLTCCRSSSGSLTAISTSVGGPRTRTNSPFVDCPCALVSTSFVGATCVPLGEFCLGPRRPNKNCNPSGGSAAALGAGVAGSVSKLARQLGQVLCCASHSSMHSLWNTCWHVGMVLITSPSSNCSMHTEQLGSSPAHLLAFQSASVYANCGMASIISRGQPVCCAALPPVWFQMTLSSRPRIRLSTCPCSIHLHTLRSRHINIAMMITSTTDMNDGGIMSSSVWSLSSVTCQLQLESR
mmetsp:Transcript_1858/g.7775  ORF Transcript_1858/g.7775 Transcript_1858/m.7775 type:complete len:265 (-) Transcript_1858:1682-2476(-)